MAGTTNMDEFGMGSDSLHSHYGPVKNSFSSDHSAGGSSGGSAVAVATEQCHAALGTDTGGSVRLPAAYNGVVGFKPSYGLISRWGVISYANSMDTVGILARSVSEARTLFSMIRSHDPRDPTSIDVEMRVRTTDRLIEHITDLGRHNSNLRIGVPQEYNTKELQPIVRKAWIRTLHRLQQAGHTIQSISLPATKMALSAYYILAPAEASSNLARYDGTRYGNKVDEQRKSGDVLFSQTRGQGLGDEVRRRILLGAYSLSAGAIDNYFIQAQKIRRLVQHDFNDVFAFPHPLMDHVSENDPQNDKVDIIVTPTAQALPPRISDLQQRDHVDAYSADVLTVPASLAGLPAISVPVPVGSESTETASGPLTAGMQVIGQFGTDMRVLTAARIIEEIHAEPSIHENLSKRIPDVTIEAPAQVPSAR